LTGKTQFCQRSLKILGIRGFQVQSFLATGVREIQRPGMQQGALNSESRGNFATIQVVPGDRQPEGSQVGADLVGAARLRAGFQQGITGEALQEAEMGDCLLPAAVIHDGAVPSITVCAQRLAGGVSFPRRIPFNQSVVDLDHLVLLELSVQEAVYRRAARQEDDTAGIFVQPVDDP